MQVKMFLSFTENGKISQKDSSMGWYSRRHVVTKRYKGMDKSILKMTTLPLIRIEATIEGEEMSGNNY